MPGKSPDKPPAGVGGAAPELLDLWMDVSRLMARLDAAARSGLTALVKVDGGRTEDTIYTVVISGRPLGEDFFRQDGPDLRALLVAAVDFCGNWRPSTDE